MGAKNAVIAGNYIGQEKSDWRWRQNL